MKKILLSIALLILVGSLMALANPLPPFEFVYVKAFPPQIGISLYDSTDISGDTLYTISGTAIVNSGIIAYGTRWNPFILDSTNTSGFVINPEADSIRMNLEFLEAAAWGRYGEASTPINGHWLVPRDYRPDPPYGMTISVLTFNFAYPHQGFSDIVINEINAHCDWAPGCNFIELYNNGTAPIDIGNWMVVCDTIYVIPSGAVIPSSGYYVIDENAFPAAFDMDYDADNVFLVNSDSQIVDQVGWSSDHTADISFMRIPDGNDGDYSYQQGHWGYNDETSVTFEDGFPTRWAPNRYNCPGLKIIGIHADTSLGSIDIYWTNPVWLSVFTDVILRRSMTGYPPTQYDGDLIYEGTGQWYSDRDVWPGNTYYYTVFARTGCGDYSVPDSESQISVSFQSVGVDQNPIPKVAALLECYPNPFNASTLIRYKLAQPGRAKVSIYNLAGQRVAQLLNGHQDAGEHAAIWDGSGFSSGIYFARLETGIESIKIKLTLLK